MRRPATGRAGRSAPLPAGRLQIAHGAVPTSTPPDMALSVAVAFNPSLLRQEAARAPRPVRGPSYNPFPRRRGVDHRGRNAPITHLLATLSHFMSDLLDAGLRFRAQNYLLPYHSRTTRYRYKPLVMPS